MMLEGSTLINYLLINLWRHHNSKICVKRGVWAFLIAVKLRIEYIYLPVFVVVVVIVGVVFFCPNADCCFLSSRLPG